jgi:hypothetical protein
MQIAAEKSGRLCDRAPSRTERTTRHDDCSGGGVRPLPLLVGLGALLAPLLTPASAAANPSPIPEGITNGLAGADENPISQMIAQEHGPSQLALRALADSATSSFPRPVIVGPGVSPLDCVHAKHDIQFDPATGVTTAHLDLELRAKDHALSAVGFTFDKGLLVGKVSADGRTTRINDAVVSPTRVLQIDLSPPLQPGESTTVHFDYAGTLNCGAYPDGDGVLCTKGDQFSYFAHQSIIPFLFDPADPASTRLDGLTRDIVLRVPADIDVISTGEHVSEVLDGDTKVSTWTIDQPLSRNLGMYVFAGKLGMKNVPGRAVPTTFVFPNPELPMDELLVSWSPGVLGFVEKIAGSPLPFQRSLTLVRLPADVGDPGTATFGMTLLSDSYAKAGDLMHEETWAHENSHLFWGIVVPELDPAESRIMTEGIATLSELDYTWANHYASMDRDTYLARRFVPIGLDLRKESASIPAVQLTANESAPDSFHSSLFTMWAYYKTSATLDHLRVTVGEDAFSKGLVAYVKKCSYVGCRPDDFRVVLEGVTGKDLAPFFDRWVSGSSRPEVSVGFQPVSGGADIQLTKDDALPMTLELWLRLEDGQLVKQRVDLEGRTTTVHIDTTARVRSVATSPRHDLLVSASSAIAGDLDFDGESDGLDLLRCTPLVGRSYQGTGSGLYDLEERFDPRCDVNNDLLIDADDIRALAQSFGTLRKP